MYLHTLVILILCISKTKKIRAATMLYSNTSLKKNRKVYFA